MGGGADSDGEDGAHSMQLRWLVAYKGGYFLQLLLAGWLMWVTQKNKRLEPYLRYEVDRLWAQADSTRRELAFNEYNQALGPKRDKARQAF